MSSPTKLPFTMADQMIDDLARRGKLTSKVLMIPMQSRVTRLKLTCLQSLDDDKSTFIFLLANQRHVVDIDLSFSPCFGQMPFPFVRTLSESCKDTLVSFSASYVRGDVGFECLRGFSLLRHLDISFTSVSFEICALA